MGFNVVKSGDKKSKVGEHFKEIGDGFMTIKNKLKELEGNISVAKNVYGSTIKVVEDAIAVSDKIFDKLIGAITKLAGVTNDSAEIVEIADNAAAVASNKDNVDVVIAEIRNIIDVAEKSGVKIEKGNAGGEVAAAANTSAPAILAHNVGVGAGATARLAAKVAKANPWVMIDKIKDSKTNTAQLVANTSYDAGTLATGGNVANGAKAATNADLAVAVVLKAMTRSGKFSTANNEADAAKATGISAVNKVLGILDVIIGRTVSSNLYKIREAVKGIKYSEIPGINASDFGNTQPDDNMDSYGDDGM